MMNVTSSVKKHLKTLRSERERFDTDIMILMDIDPIVKYRKNPQQI